LEHYSKQYQIVRNDIGNAGTVASLTKRELKKRGLSREFVKKVIIGIYEAEINVVIHSYGGTCDVEINDEFIRVTYRDIGPGIECITSAMTAGFSTASKIAIENGFGAGMGLPNIKSVSDEMSLESTKEGTILCIKFNISKENYAVS
jgi:serine/threonine-protein kinase RsbT